MKCLNCGGALTSRRANVSYAASGLPHVQLVGVTVRRCQECGESEIAIPHIEKLHRVLADAVIRKPTQLTAGEVRFLRKFLGWSGQDFARNMGVSPETVSRWENGREKMSPTADRLLRLMVVTKQPIDHYGADELAAIRKKASPLRLRLAPSTTDWRRMSASA